MSAYRTALRTEFRRDGKRRIANWAIVDPARRSVAYRMSLILDIEGIPELLQIEVVSFLHDDRQATAFRLRDARYRMKQGIERAVRRGRLVF